MNEYKKFRVYFLDEEHLPVNCIESISYKELLYTTDFTPCEVGQIQNLGFGSGLVIGNMRMYRI